MARLNEKNACPIALSTTLAVTLLKSGFTTLESEITPEIEIKKQPKWKTRRLLPAGTIITKHFKGRVLEIVVTEDGFKYEGRTYKSISGLAMEITGYPVSGYVFFDKELKNDTK